MQQIIAYEQSNQGEKKGTFLRETSNSISEEVMAEVPQLGVNEVCIHISWCDLFVPGATLPTHIPKH